MQNWIVVFKIVFFCLVFLIHDNLQAVVVWFWFFGLVILIYSCTITSFFFSSSMISVQVVFNLGKPTHCPGLTKAISLPSPSHCLVLPSETLYQMQYW